MGPHTFNFTEAAELSLAAGASLRVPDIAEGVRRAIELALGSERAAWSLRAQGFAAKNRGAAQRMAGLIAERLRLIPSTAPAA
jgi:3-deoxy-D-manno-octulosonic-acid transferase